MTAGRQDRAAARRRIALEIAGEIEEAVARGRPADRALAARFRAHRGYGSRDRRFYAEAVFALFRWRGWTGSFAAGGEQALLRAHWLDVEDPDPEFRAWAVEAGAAFADTPGWGGLALEARAAALAGAGGLDRPPDPAALVPEWIGPALAAQAGSLDSWIRAFQARPPLWLRAVGIPGEELCRRLREQGVAAQPHATLTTAVAVEGHPHLPGLARAIGPCFEVQDLSAQAVIACATPTLGEHWWDACAGSGGKALALAERVGPRGRVLATDRRPEAVREMHRRIRASAARDARPVARVRDATRPPGGGVFDGVLLDAPCSGIGTWNRNPDARWRTTLRTLEASARIQARLLTAAADAVRAGGRIVYAVCTPGHRETAGQIEAFLAQRPDFEPAPTAAPLGGPPSHAHWVHPSDGPCSGMYIAVLRRVS